MVRRMSRSNVAHTCCSMILVLMKRIARVKKIERVKITALFKRIIAFSLLTNCKGLPNPCVNNAIHAKTDRAIDSC